MQFRRAATLTVGFEAGEFEVHNFLTKDRFTCSAECLSFIAKLDDWHSAKDISRYFPDASARSLKSQVSELVGLNAIVMKGTEQAERDETYRREWRWGAIAGLFHFSVSDTPFVVGAPAQRFMRKKAAGKPSPPLHQTNRGMRKVAKLPRTDTTQEPYALMHRRRSRRGFDGRAISRQALADCLFAGNGIVKFVEGGDYGRLPYTMTPSGGARNPFELYVYANKVTDLKTGLYHYSALDHDLGLVRAGKVDVAPLLGGQRWPAKASAIVFLVAHFPRTMWKYHLPIAYRIVMMEAGFICQNIALSATAHGLSAVPSGAIKDSLIAEYLGTPPVESSPVFTVSLGVAKSDDY